MPWSAKQHSFFSMCANRKGRKKARSKCPSLKDAKRMMKEGVKK
jgi:hypothetical protein